MTVANLEALARAYQSDDGMDPELLVLGHHLPQSQYDHSLNWNAILRLGKYQGSQVYFYAPRSWEHFDHGRGEAGYQLHFADEPTRETAPPHTRKHDELDQTPDNTHVDFTLTIPEGTIDRIIFLNACNDGNPLPDGAEHLTASGIVSTNTTPTP